MQWLLVRVYGGVDDLFEREAECQIFAAVAQAGLGPRLLVSLALDGTAGCAAHLVQSLSLACRQASFGNGRIEEFLLDQNIDAPLMKMPKIAAITGVSSLAEYACVTCACNVSLIASMQPASMPLED